jgi:hypothetical protein
MIFIDYLGPSTDFQEIQSQIAAEVGLVMRAQTSNIVIRRILTDPEPEEIEIWIELSSDEQLFRHGRTLAQGISTRLRAHTEANVWVMFRIVPLSQAFLNGRPRARGHATFD